MEQSKVYFTDFRAKTGQNVLQKLEKIVKQAGIEKIDFKNKYVAIKIHFGEPGNLAYLRPNYAKVIADVVKSLGGKPFLTDCNTLYVGRRKNAIDHLEAAYENGYSPFSTGCHVIIADGIKGTDEALIPVDGGEYVKEAKIGKAIVDSDIIISLNHFKGHEATGFGGALKNLGMGCGSRAGKMEMHSSGKPSVHTLKCKNCKACFKQCAHGAISFIDGKAVINHDKCVGCGRCIGSCNFDAVLSASDESNDILNKKIAEYTKAVLEGKQHFHINILSDISPNCDCHSENDAPIVPNIGMLASFDPVAIDMASVDLVNGEQVLAGSVLEEHIKQGIVEQDHLVTNHPDTNWKVAIDHAEKMKIGNSHYIFEKIK